MVKKRTTPPSVTSSIRSKLASAAIARLGEPSTWCGLLTIGAAVATGGLSTWLNPASLPYLTAGVGLILSKDSKTMTED